MKRSFLAFVALFVAALPIVAQVSPEKATATLKIVDPLEISLWASEPLFVNPTSMDVDHLGRVWVCEAVNYRAKSNLRPAGDRIVILEDTKGAGKADKATVFYQGKELQSPLGIVVSKDVVGPGYRVYVCQSPNILLFEDKDGDGKADGPPTKFLTNFGGQNHDHGVHGLHIGPDNRFYFSVGDTGVHGLQGTDKKGRIWKSNATDCRAGTIWRCDLDGGNLEQIAHNFRNEYEPCVDSFGTVFVSDNDDDGNQQTRICYVMPGGNYGYHPRGPGQTHWHEEQPGVVPKILRTYFGSPTGMCMYEGNLLPEKYRGQPLHTDAGPRHVRCYHLTPDGAGYSVDREDMVTSTDNWFRPSDICVGPDGSVFVADWYDPGVGGHGMGDWTRGRIFRISPRTAVRGLPPKIDLSNKEGITAALASPNLAVRHMAMAKFHAIDKKEAGDICEAAAVQKDNVFLRARALWQLGRIGKLRLVNAAFEDKDPRFRILAMRVLKDTQKHSPADYLDEWKKKLVADPSAQVRREAILLLRDVEPAKAKPLIIELAKKYDGQDRFYLEAIGIAVGHHDQARRETVLADFDKQFLEWNEKTANLVWELRPPAMLPQLEKKLADAKLAPILRSQIVGILAAGEDTAGGLALLRVLQTETPVEVRDEVVKNLQLFLPGKWRSLRDSKEVTAVIDRFLAKPETRAAALALIGAAEKTDAVGKVAAIAKDQPALRTVAIQTLGSLPTADAVAALQMLGNADAVQALGKLAKGNAKLPATGAALKALQGIVQAEKQEISLRLAAINALTGTRPGTVWLLEVAEKKSLADNLKTDTARLLRNTPYQDLRARVLVAFPLPGRLDPKKLPAIAKLAQRRGSVENGKKLLAASPKTDLQCLKCHTLMGVGGSVGPDLSVIGKKASRENLFESLIDPSKAIADQYLAWVVETKAGLIVSGLIVEETADHVLLRDANGKDTKVAKKEIDSRTKSPKSLMPDNLLVFMTEDDLVDIVEYLFTLKTAVLGMDYWRIIGPFDNGASDAGLDQTFPPEKEIDLKASYPGKSGKVAWKTVRPDAQGYVDLQAHFKGDSDNIVSYCYREVESPIDQEVLVLLGTDDAAKLFVNGTSVYTNRKHRAAKPGEDSVKVKLRKGKNSLLLKVTNGDGAYGFYLTILASEEMKRIESK